MEDALFIQRVAMQTMGNEGRKCHYKTEIIFYKRNIQDGRHISRINTEIKVCTI
ncbi:hypothetical protein KSS87_013394, partial [Heliosperma pusillum]